MDVPPIIMNIGIMNSLSSVLRLWIALSANNLELGALPVTTVTVVSNHNFETFMKNYSKTGISYNYHRIENSFNQCTTYHKIRI